MGIVSSKPEHRWPDRHIPFVIDDNDFPQTVRVGLSAFGRQLVMVRQEATRRFVAQRPYATRTSWTFARRSSGTALSAHA